MAERIGKRKGDSMEYVINIVLLFFTFSLIGWCIEVTLKYRQFHRFINRGFLMGPCLPIYGWGAVLITLSVEAVKKYDFSVFTTFVVSFIVCGFIEYMTSFVMEKQFHARWWDYSQKPMNLNGRVWIGNLVLFGLGGLLIIYIANPFFFGLYEKAGLLTREIVAGVLVVLFIADSIMSLFVMRLVKQGVDNSEADNTEAIGKEIRQLLGDKSLFHRRFVEAYPDVIYKTERIAARMEAIKAETERLRKEAEKTIGAIGQKVTEEKEQLLSNLETSNSMKNAIIEKQDALLVLLYDDEKATDEMKQLKREIEDKKTKLSGKQLKIFSR